MRPEYEDITLTLTLHKNIIALLKTFSKTFFYMNHENIEDEDGYDDLLSTDNYKTNIKVSKKKIQDYISNEITKDMKQLAGEIIRDKQIADNVKHVIKTLLEDVGEDIEEDEDDTVNIPIDRDLIDRLERLEERKQKQQDTIELPSKEEVEKKYGEIPSDESSEEDLK